MKTIDELCISPYPWDFQPSHPDGCRVATAYNRDVSTSDPANARLIAYLPKLYERAYRLVLELEKVIDHTPAGDTVIDCECSHVELAMVELREAMEEASGESEVKKTVNRDCINWSGDHCAKFKSNGCPNGHCEHFKKVRK